MIVLAVTWMANAGHEDEVAEIFRKLAGRLPPGAGLPDVHRSSPSDDPRRFFIYEQYRDDAALEAHRNSPHFQEYAVKALKDIGERTEGDLLLAATTKARQAPQPVASVVGRRSALPQDREQRRPGPTPRPVRGTIPEIQTPRLLPG